MPPGGVVPVEVEERPQDEHVHAEEDARHPVVVVVVDERRREGDEGDEHQDQDVQPGVVSVGPFYDGGLLVVYDPEDRGEEEALGVVGKYVALARDQAEEVGIQPLSSALGELQVQDQERHGHGEDPVGEGLDPVGGHSGDVRVGGGHLVGGFYFGVYEMCDGVSRSGGKCEVQSVVKADVVIRQVTFFP